MNKNSAPAGIQRCRVMFHWTLVVFWSWRWTMSKQRCLKIVLFRHCFSSQNLSCCKVVFLKSIFEPGIKVVRRSCFWCHFSDNNLLKWESSATAVSFLCFLCNVMVLHVMVCFFYLFYPALLSTANLIRRQR